jgi:hypothetical protein
MIPKDKPSFNLSLQAKITNDAMERIHHRQDQLKRNSRDQ